MSFMAVAYVPAFVEDRATFANERANGLVGPLTFAIANFLIGLPFLVFDYTDLLRRHLLVVQLSARRRRLLDVGAVVVP